MAAYHVRVLEPAVEELAQLDQPTGRRIIYEILQGEQEIVVHQIGHRREIYRKK